MTRYNRAFELSFVGSRRQAHRDDELTVTAFEVSHPPVRRRALPESRRVANAFVLRRYRVGGGVVAAPPAPICS
jgi:hypothetical protein